MEDAPADRALLRDWARAAEECRRVPPAARLRASCCPLLRAPHRATAQAPQQPACARAGAQHAAVASRRGPHLTRLRLAPLHLAPSSAHSLTHVDALSWLTAPDASHAAADADDEAQRTQARPARAAAARVARPPVLLALVGR